MTDPRAGRLAATMPIALTLALALAMPLTLVVGPRGAVASSRDGAAATTGVPSDARPGPGFVRTGDAPDDGELRLALGLARDSAALEAAALAVSDPASDDYGRHVGVGDLAGLAGTVGTGPRVVEVLTAAGVDARVDPTGLFVHARLSVAEAESLFSTPWGAYTGPGLAADIPYLAADDEPTLPAGLDGLLAELTGFTMALPYTSIPTGAAVPAATAAGLPAPTNTGTPDGCAAAQATGGFTTDQLATAYGIDQSQATAAHVAVLIDGEGFLPDTYEAFATCFGVGLPTPQVHLVPPQASPVTQSLGEVDGDVQTVVGAAPMIGRVDVVQGVYGMYQWPLLFAAALDPAVTGSPPHAVTMSDGDPETQLPDATMRLLEDLFVAYALVGTTMAAPAGDFGSVSFPGVAGNPQSYPASSRWVTSIGGTNVTLDAGNQITDELVWDDGRYEGYQSQATGGGPSTRFPSPPWQGTATRQLPDVSFFASAYPGFAQADDFGSGVEWFANSGTSFASPLFAAGIALADARLEAAGRPRLGLVTPLLYREADALWASGAVHDITEGTNDLTGIGCCTAAIGYDMASGLGSLRFDLLADAAMELGGAPVPLEPVPPAAAPVAAVAAVAAVAVPRFTG